MSTKNFSIVNWDTGEIVATLDDLRVAKIQCRKMGHLNDATPLDKWYSPIAYVGTEINILGDNTQAVAYNPRFKNPNFGGI